MPNDYRGHVIERAWDGFKIRYPSGATSPETYGTLDAARKSIDFDLKAVKK